MEEDFDINKIRQQIADLAHAINNQKRRGLMPYDWSEYGHPEMWRLCEYAKVSLDGKVKKKDKRGAWR